MRIWHKVILFLLIASIGYAADPPMTLYDEASKQGVIFNLNCAGSAISCTKTGTTGTIQVNATAGASTVLDIGDNGVNESDALAEIATTGDANSIFTEPSGDKLLIDLTKDWPKADAVDFGGINWTDVYVPDTSINWAVQVPLNETDAANDTCAEITGCVENAITAAGVPAAETDAAHDTCAEISGCVVGAITSETDSAHDTCAEISGCVVSAITAAGVPAAETDPQVGTLTNSKWCTSDGSAVNCATDAPSGAGDVLGPATNTADNFPQWNGADSKTLKNGLAVDASGACASSTLCGGGHTHPQASQVTKAVCVANITSDLPAAIDPAGCDIISLTSDNTTNTNRTFCIAAGTEGQTLVLVADVSGSNEIDLDDGAGGSCSGSTGAAQYLDSDWPPFSSQNNDTLTIIYHAGDSTGWFETSRSAN